MLTAKGTDSRLRAFIRRWRPWRLPIIFLVCLISLDLVVHSFRATWRYYDPDDYRERVRACRDGKWDMVLVGGSPVHEGIDPALLSGITWRGAPLKRVFNCGLEGATTSETWHAVAHGIRTPPKVLLYGVTASDLNEGRNEGHGPRMNMTPGDVVTSCRLRPGSISFCVRHWLRGQASRSWNVYHYRQGMRLWLADQLPDFAPEAAEEIENNRRISHAIATNQGYAPRPEMQSRRLDDLKKRGWTGLPFRFLHNYRMGGYQLYLERMLEWARERQVTPILVDMPVSADLEELHFAPAFVQYRAALRDIAGQHQVQVIWASRANVGLTDADFADLIHLNLRGTQRFTTWLREQLARVDEPENYQGAIAGGRP